MLRCAPLFLLAAACASAAAVTGDAVYRRDPWTLHDPGFPVEVDVAPSHDELWAVEHAEPLEAGADGVLRVSSSVLDVTVVLPDGVDTDDALVTMSLFEPSSSGEGDGTATTPSFEMSVDSQLQYVRQYRVELDPSTAGERFVLRVYVEASASRQNGTEAEEGGARLRAFYVRWVDLSPSEPRFLVCEQQQEAVHDASDATDGDEEEEEEDEEARVAVHPPANMPPGLCRRYTMDGRVPVRKWYFDDQTDADRSYGEEYSLEIIETLVEDARKHMVGYSATDAFLHEALKKYPLAGKHVLVVGSRGLPWIESLCLSQEAASCTTVARNRLIYDHPKLQTFTTAEFEDANAGRGSGKRFDVVFAVTTLASEGLGRTGDLLDPDADLKAMRELRDLSTPLCAEGKKEIMETTTVFLSVPVGPDTLVWNAQRHYGPLRLPLLLQDWELLDSFGFQKSDFTAPFTVNHLPLFVLQPSSSCAQEPTDSNESEGHAEL
ncbi:hypothetical protein BBJ28_00013251 [Nothophytophthora sp. Chile5]|nr:hypothetical protein BBJ28_00013251 [Nothophytophthora sp. Chile5]